LPPPLSCHRFTNLYRLFLQVFLPAESVILSIGRIRLFPVCSIFAHISPPFLNMTCRAGRQNRRPFFLCPFFPPRLFVLPPSATRFFPPPSMTPFGKPGFSFFFQIPLLELGTASTMLPSPSWCLTVSSLIFTPPSP